MSACGSRRGQGRVPARHLPGRMRPAAAAALAGLAVVLGACGRSGSAAPTPAPARPAPAAAASVPAAAPAASPGPAAADVTTYHGDLLRTGWQQDETTLGPGAVAGGAFGGLWTSVPLGGDLHGQPLFVAGVSIGGVAHNVVYAATDADTVWALDAQTGHVLWGPVSVGTPVPASALECGDVNPVGITGTPVADPSRGALYAVAMTMPAGGSAPRYELVGLRLDDGGPLPGFPVPITPRVAGGPAFDARVQQERGALTLLPGGNVLEVPFGGFDGDCGDYHGWVQQVWLPHPQDQASYVTPTAREGGLWGAAGLAYGPEGALFGVTGNSSGASPTDMGDAVLRLLPTPHLSQPAGPAGFFAPSNAVRLDVTDFDLGTAGPLLLPPQPGPYPYLLFTMGKQGVGYLVDRWYPGGVSGGDGVSGEGVWSGCMYGTCAGGGAAVFSEAAYYATGSAQYVLTAGITAQQAPCAGRGGLEAWRLETGTDVARPSLSLAWCGPSMTDPGSPTVSSDGPHGAVAWILDAGSARLLAVDGTTGRLLWEGPVLPVERFTVPTVADGAVFVPTTTAIQAFGLRAG